jgi:hypothetical protein
MRWSSAGSWRWLRNAGNRTVLGWLGGGLVVLAGGLWIVFTHVSTGGGAITLGTQPAPSADKPPANNKAGARP